MHIVIGGYCPGALGRVAEMHAEYYHRHWGFGLFFEAKVATELSEFLCRFEKRRDGFWTLMSGDRVEGAIAIDGRYRDFPMWSFVIPSIVLMLWKTITLLRTDPVVRDHRFARALSFGRAAPSWAVTAYRWLPLGTSRSTNTVVGARVEPTRTKPPAAAARYTT